MLLFLKIFNFRHFLAFFCYHRRITKKMPRAQFFFIFFLFFSMLLFFLTIKALNVVIFIFSIFFFTKKFLDIKMDILRMSNFEIHKKVLENFLLRVKNSVFSLLLRKVTNLAFLKNNFFPKLNKCY